MDRALLPAISSMWRQPQRSPDSQDLMIRKSLAYWRARGQARLLVSQAVCHSVHSLRRPYRSKCDAFDSCGLPARSARIIERSGASLSSRFRRAVTSAESEPRKVKGSAPFISGTSLAVYLVGKNAGMDVIIGDEDYVIMREREILGRIGIIEKAKRARK